MARCACGHLLVGSRAAARTAALTREVVLDAALTLFAQRGYHGTALSEIADALQVRTPSLYNHMDSKHELLRTIVDRTTAGVLTDFHAAVDPDDPPVEQLRRAAEVYAHRHATHRREALVVNRDTGSLEEPARSDLQARRREHEHALRAVIARGVEQGRLPRRVAGPRVVRRPGAVREHRALVLRRR